MTAAENERLAVVENEVKGLRKDVCDLQDLVRTAMEQKADKSELADVRKLVIGALVGVAGFCAVTLVGMFVFLIYRFIERGL